MEESAGFVVVLVVMVGGFLGRGSFFPNCQSDDVVEQLFGSVAAVSFNSCSVVFDVDGVDGSFVDEVVPEVGPEVEPEPVALFVDEVELRRIDRTGRASRTCRKGVDAALGSLVFLGGLWWVEGVSELVEVTDGSFGFWAFCVWLR